MFICTLDLRRGPISIRGMNSETWLDKATRLQESLARHGKPPGFAEDEIAARERIEIALWLRREFSAGEEPNVICFPPSVEGGRDGSVR